MAFPVGCDALAGILKPPRVLARESQDQDVGPAVAVEITRMREEVGTVFVLVAQSALVATEGHIHPVALALGNLVRRCVLVTHLEGRALIPERTRDHVGHTIPVDVRKTGSLGPELIAQFLFVERMKPGSRSPGEQVGAPGRQQSGSSGSSGSHQEAN